MNEAFPGVIGKLLNVCGFERLKIFVRVASPFEKSFIFSNDNAQIELGVCARLRRCGRMQVSESLFPFFDFSGALPSSEALLNGAEVGDGLHEGGNLYVVL